MKIVPSGRKNQKIAIYSPVTGKTPSGALLKNKFRFIAKPWASVITKQQSESEIGSSQQSKIVYSIVIGWREISPDWVIIWRGQVLRVMNIDDSDSARRQKILLASSENGVQEGDFLENSVVD